MTNPLPPHKSSHRPLPRKEGGVGDRGGASVPQVQTVQEAAALCDALQTISAPKQSRSEQTLARILEAAERLIVERGVENVSVSDIVREARSSVGGFYGRFRDKEELLVALSERSQLRLQDKVQGLLDARRWAGASLSEIVRGCAAELVSHVAQRRRLQAAFLHSVAVRPERWTSGIAFRQRLSEGFAALLLARRDEIRHPDPETGTRVATDAVFALMDQRALFGHLEGTWQIDDACLVDEITRLVLGYLGVRAPSSEH